MIEIPVDRLSPELLQAVIEDFVSREATDYGVHEVDFSIKVAQVERQIASGEVVIIFDPDSETCNLLTRHQFRQIQP